MTVLSWYFVRFLSKPAQAKPSIAAPYRMSCSETVIRSRSKARITSTRVTTPATMVGARSACRPRISCAWRAARTASTQHGAGCSAARAVAVDAVRVVGLEFHLDRRQRGRRPGHRDSRLGGRPPRLPPRSARAGRRPALPARPGWADRRRGGARCGGRRRPAARRATRSPACRRSARSSHRRCRSPGWGPRAGLRGGAEVGEPRLFLAVEDPCRERESLAQLGDEGARRWRRRGPRWWRSLDLLGAQLPQCRDVGVDRRAGGLDRLGGEAAAEVDAAPSRVTVLRRSIGLTRPPSTSATSSRVEFEPMSMTATSECPASGTLFSRAGGTSTPAEPGNQRPVAKIPCSSRGGAAR